MRLSDLMATFQVREIIKEQYNMEGNRVKENLNKFKVNT